MEQQRVWHATNRPARQVAGVFPFLYTKTDFDGLYRHDIEALGLTVVSMTAVVVRLVACADGGGKDFFPAYPMMSKAKARACGLLRDGIHVDFYS